MEDGGWPARSVLDGGSPLPLLHPSAGRTRFQIARGLAQSKAWWSLVASPVFLVVAITARAQSYSIDWFRIAGGGSTSTGGVYSVNGTIGQHDAGGPMTNGPYSLVGGFWVLPILVQTPGAPALSISLNPQLSTITLWWTPPTPDFTLQFTDGLSPTNWVNAPSGTNNPATVPATLPARFYRVSKQ